jgi:hypothetical protein
LRWTICSAHQSHPLTLVVKRANELRRELEACSLSFAGMAGATGGYLLLCYDVTRVRRFHVMRDSEGRNDPFSVLKTFLRHPPKVVVYDFACSLEEYSLNRDPFWFRDTLFCSDSFHWGNHTGYVRCVMTCELVFVGAPKRTVLPSTNNIAC